MIKYFIKISFLNSIMTILKFLALRFILIFENVNYIPLFNIYKIRVFLYKIVLKKIGKNCMIGPNVSIKYPENLSLGNRVSIHRGTYINAISGISIGDNCGISNNCTFSGGQHIHESIDIPIKDQGMKLDPILIDEDVLIGNNSVITSGTVVKRGTYIGALTLVNGKIPEYSIVLGNPCRIIGKRNQK